MHYWSAAACRCVLTASYGVVLFAAENVRFQDFCDSVRALFGADIRFQDIKYVFQKISTNPDAKYDWSEVLCCILYLSNITLCRGMSMLYRLFSRRLISHYGRRPSYNRLTNCVAVHIYGISSAMKSTSRFFRGCFKNSGTENSHTEILVSLIHGNRTSDEEQTCTQVTL